MQLGQGHLLCICNMKRLASCHVVQVSSTERILHTANRWELEYQNRGDKLPSLLAIESPMNVKGLCVREHATLLMYKYLFGFDNVELCSLSY